MCFLYLKIKALGCEIIWGSHYNRWRTYCICIVNKTEMYVLVDSTHLVTPVNLM